MIRRSVTFRLVRAIVCLELVLIVSVGLAVYYEAEGFFHRYFDSSLLARAEAIGLMIDNDAGRLRLEEPVRPIRRPRETSERPDVYWVWPDSGEPIENAPVSRELDAVRSQIAQPAAGRRVLSDVRYGDRDYRAAWVRLSVPPARSTSRPDTPTFAPAGARDVNVLLAISRHPVENAVRDLIQFLLMLTGGLVVGTAVATILLVRWGLGPIRKAADEIAMVTASNVGLSPLGAPNPPEEIRPFTQALNDLLDRLGTALRQQRDFTANASHELRTPMAVIKSTLQSCLLRPRDPNEYREAMVEVLDDLIRIEHVIDQLLLLAQLDANVETTPFAMQSVELSTLLADVVGRYQAQADAASVQLELGSLEPVRIRGNPDLIDRLFANLVGNAIVHNRAGGQVRIDCARRDGLAVVEVADTGPGIPAEAIDRIFERFYRADRSRTRQNGQTGTGLGLAIAREIARRHGGQVTAENRPTGGALFRVHLPVPAGPDPAASDGTIAGRAK